MNIRNKLTRAADWYASLTPIQRAQIVTVAFFAGMLIGAVIACSPQNRSAITITQRAGRYIATVDGRSERIGRTAAEASVIATRLMLQHAVENPSGGVLIAPADVLDLVPAHLRDVPAVPR